jgi:tRNA 2-thiouridine synthesizing protein A
MTLPETWTAEIDARGLLCPLPVLRARKRLLALPEGAVLRVLADDPAAAIDMPHFCAEAGHVLLAATGAEGGATAYLIRRGSGAAR